MRRSMRVFTGIVLLALLAMPAGWTGAIAAPKLKLKSHDFEGPGGQVVKAELGSFKVRENRADPKSRKITLRFVRFATTSADPGPPIVYLAGGPGGSATGAASGTRFPIFMALREFGDVIAFDQRGTGITGFEELDCDDRYLVPLATPLQREQAGAIIANVTHDCARRMRKSGIDLSAYNTRESAADLDDLRKALGVEKIRLWGISYGTHLALAAMKYHGEGIDRVMLAGLEGLDHSLKLPSDQQDLLAEIAKLAAADPAVREAVPDLLGSIARLSRSLEKEPRSVSLTLPGQEAATEVAVGKFDLQLAIAGLLRGPASFAFLPDAVARVEAGDWTALVLASAQRRSGEGIHGMTAAMDCASGATRSRIERIRKEAAETLLGDAINFPFPEVCAKLEIPDLGDRFREPLVSDIPALLISGTLDGRTPVGNGEEVLEGLKNGVHLILEGAGHSDPLFLSSPQILEAMKSFLRGEELSTTKIVLPPMEFVAPRALAELSDLDRYVGRYRIDEENVRTVIRAGDMLYTQRNRWSPLPIRPLSEREFFYEGSRTTLEFQFDENGQVTGMVVYHDGGDEGEPARKL